MPSGCSQARSHHPCRRLREPDVMALIGEFERIDRQRTSVLRVIRHDLAEREFYVDRCRSGEWGVMTTSGVSSSISVGAILTAGCAGERDVSRLVAACYENTILGEPPDSRQIDRYLAAAGAPPNERPWPDETPTIGFGNTLRGVLLATGLCKAVENEANLMSPERLAEAVVPTGRLGRALLHLADRLGLSLVQSLRPFLRHVGNHRRLGSPRPRAHRRRLA